MRMWWTQFSTVPRAAEDGSGSGGTAAPPAAGGQAPPAPPAVADQSAPPAAGQSAAPAPAAPYRFEGLPDHLAGATDRETIDKLHKAYSGARDAIAKAGEVPRDVAGYVFQPSETVAPYAKDLDKDPFFTTTQEAALKHGLTTRQFNGFVGDLMEAMVSKGIVAEPFSADKERAALAPDIADPKERARTVDRMIRENQALVKAWQERGDIPEAVAVWLTAQTDRAAPNQLIDWIRTQRGEQRPALGGQSAGAASKATLDARIADPRNQVNSPKFDPNFAAETTRLFKEFYSGA